MRPPADLDVPANWQRTEYYLSTITDSWRVYCYRDRAHGDRLTGQLWRMRGVPEMVHHGSVESCIEFARAHK